MKNIIRAIVIAAVATSITGCGITGFNTSNTNDNVTSVEFSKANFTVIKRVSGFSSSSYVLGIGGLSRRAARQNAVDDMFKKANLKGSQTIANIYVKSHISTVFGLYTRISYSATGDVIEFLQETPTSEFLQETPISDHQTHLPLQESPAAIDSQSAQDNTPYYTIGDIYNDGDKEGIVFEVSDNGLHGKIVFNKIFTWFPWSVKSADDNVLTTDEFDGENNMKIIKSIDNWQELYPAFAECSKLGEGWYLPAVEELRQIIPIRKKANMEFFDTIWSSTATQKGFAFTFPYFKERNRVAKCAILAVAKF